MMWAAARRTLMMADLESAGQGRKEKSSGACESKIQFRKISHMFFEMAKRNQTCCEKGVQPPPVIFCRNHVT